jgi:hypothetical protein
LTVTINHQNNTTIKSMKPAIINQSMVVIESPPPTTTNQ